ncbi:uncharacterized protein A4U43_C03F27100 [Asparagus officinalis]|uniref:J domain-containing protein n=1 Tax=Asparagus officinalis TaxID=4686 RepID=A0A5P1FE51_ASPOF|nr:J domain-containing protein required for chloroplast accumulation response 1-like isoform X2 [Asparagus officinalis]ONK76382.1 uncharacterized protein A4U43_C03F27100 [Asparagus officinalis]
MKLTRLMDQGMRSPSQCSMYKCDDGFPESIPSSPTTSVTSFTNRLVTAHDDLKTDGHVLYRQSPLSRQVSYSMEKSSEAMDSSSLGIKNHFQKDSASLENDVSRGHFHFSIYKWAGKGVTLVMPSKSNLQHESRFRRLPEIVVQEVDMILHEDDMLSIPNTTYKSEGNLAKSVNGITTETKVTAESTTPKGSFPSELVSKFIHSDETETSDDIDICNSKNEGVSVIMNEAQTHNLKNLKQLVDDDLEKQQNEEITGRKVRDTTVSPEEKIAGTRVKGLVKDFIKIFNQEDSQKRKDKIDEQVRTTSRSYDSRLSGAPFPINQNSEMSEKVDSNISFDVHMTDDPLSERKDPLRPSSDSTPDILDGSVNIEDLNCDDLEGCLIETVSPDDKKDLKSISNQDQFKSIDAKVREWSKGKEGNIRSLLSTLQYVLWPESGWKPVPLVDIIEGASVKRAYQKALLRLHPDKLQQKGAAPHQKYIAEKVFDIMQEAWDHFNSSSQIF